LLGSEAGAIILKIAYGYSPEQKGVDPLITMIETMMKNFSEAFVPLSWAVDIFPLLQYLPSWVPGTTYHETARVWRNINDAVINVPFAFVKQQMAEKIARPSYVSRHIEKIIEIEKNLSIDDEDTIKQSASNLYAGGSDTTVSSLSAFVLAMIKFPDVQRKAQAEIDALTGSERLPLLSDREKLPYVDGLVKEVLRWFPIAPMGAAHLVDEDTELRGYLIPKGANVLPAVRWFLHDPAVYLNPESFNPDRHLSPRNEPDPRDLIFGFGRRVCPGRHLAEAGLFITIARLLATFEVHRAADGLGRPIEPQILSNPGLIDHPVEFPYHIQPRSSKHAALVRDCQSEYPWDKEDASSLKKWHI
jgi:fumagillin biosynthesis cytochrome P450 monooxygenase